MTGGQPVEGTLTVPQVLAEGVERVVVVADDPSRYGRRPDLPPGVALHNRRDLDAVQRSLREYAGLSVLVYDQVCAAEKRRRRKRKLMPDPARRVVINDRVCEGCGDCSRTSNCMSVVPVETEWGRKREIDQSSCNKDFACIEGFCPSFVTVEGGRLRKGQALEPVGGLGASGGLGSVGGLGVAESPAAPAMDAAKPTPLPEPEQPRLDRPYSILVTGVGGTGVVTIGALLGTAAALEGKGASVLDMAGLAQKGGPVTSHIRIAESQDQLHASRIATGEANLLLGCDLVVAAGEDALSKLRAGVSRVVVNDDFSVTSDFVRTFAAQARTGDTGAVADPQFPADGMVAALARAVGSGNLHRVGATRIATALLGDSIATNLFMVGFAYQQGFLPFSAASILAAIEKNGVSVTMNKGAFEWGRKAALNPTSVSTRAAPPRPDALQALSASLEEVVVRRMEELTAYQSAAYARRYERLVRRAVEAEGRAAPSHMDFAEAVARSYYKLLAYKDEYEVARLHTQTGFTDRIASMFEGDYKLVFHLAPPLLARKDPVTGQPRKRAFGPWMLRTFGVLAKLRRLRGTPLDPFGYSEDRRLDHRLLAAYKSSMEKVLARLGPDTHAVAVELATLPDAVRGYGHVRARHAAHMTERQDELIGLLDQPVGAAIPAEEGKEARPPVVMAG